MISLEPADEQNLTHGTIASIQAIHRQGYSQPCSCSLIDLLQLQERIFVSQTITRKQLTKSQEFPNPICCNSTGGWCCASDTATRACLVNAGTRLAPNEPGQRKCLKCSKMFQSTGAANRICKACSKINSGLYLTENQIARERGEKRLNGNLLDSKDSYRMNF